MSVPRLNASDMPRSDSAPLGSVTELMTCSGSRTEPRFSNDANSEKDVSGGADAQGQSVLRAGGQTSRGV